MHLQGFRAQLHHYRIGQAGAIEQDRVVDQTYATLTAAVEIAAHADRIAPACRVHDDVADHVGVFPPEVRRPARLLGLAIRADQFHFTVDRTLDPVVIDFSPLVPHPHQHPAGSAVHVVVAHPEYRIRISHLVVLHVNRVPRGAGTGIGKLAVLERERTGILVRTENAVRRTEPDHAVADGDVVRFAENAGACSAAHFEAIEDDVVGAFELDRVIAALQTRARRARNTTPADDHRIGGSAAVVATDDDIAVVGRVAVDFDDVAGLEVVAGENRRQLGVLPTAGADGIGRGHCGTGRKEEERRYGTGHSTHIRSLGGKYPAIVAIESRPVFCSPAHNRRSMDY